MLKYSLFSRVEGIYYTWILFSLSRKNLVYYTFVTKAYFYIIPTPGWVVWKTFKDIPLSINLTCSKLVPVYGSRSRTTVHLLLLLLLLSFTAKTFTRNFAWNSRLSLFRNCVKWYKKLSNTSCQINDVKHKQSNKSCRIQAVKQKLSNTSCQTKAVQHKLSITSYQTQAVKQSRMKAEKCKVPNKSCQIQTVKN